MNRLSCPICDKPYSFCRDAISVCGSCGHEIERADPGEEVPRIAPGRGRGVVAGVLLIVGLGCLFVSEIVGAVGIAFIFAAIGLANSESVRCGNCGANLLNDKASWCCTCGASLSFGVK